MLASFTQTYGDARKEIYDLKEFDIPDICFRKLCDTNYYSFHNCSSSTIDYTKSKKWFEQSNYNILQHNNISYPESWRRSLETIKSSGVKYLAFLQDDVFCYANPRQVKELVNYVKTHDFDMLNIESPITDFGDIANKTNVLYKGSTFDVYNTTNRDLVVNGKNVWSFDDAPYIANVDFLLREVYDQYYYTHPNIWQAEFVLKNKMDHKIIPRNVCSVKLFERTNIVGQNTWNREPTLKVMREHLKCYGFPEK